MKPSDLVKNIQILERDHLFCTWMKFTMGEKIMASNLNQHGDTVAGFVETLRKIANTIESHYE